jgi:hypothetical protein
MSGLVTVAYRPKPLFKAPRPGEGAQTANHANSAATGSASLSNTAASYSTLGGKWRVNSIVGAETDFAMFGYQVPSTHRLVLTGCMISSVVVVALGAAGGVLEWSLGLDSTAVSLATTDADPVFGPRRLPIGHQGFIGSAAAGVGAPPLQAIFGSPLIIKPNRFLHVIYKQSTGEATGTFRGAVMFDGFFEPADDILSGG